MNKISMRGNAVEVLCNFGYAEMRSALRKCLIDSGVRDSYNADFHWVFVPICDPLVDYDFWCIHV